MDIWLNRKVVIFGGVGGGGGGGTALDNMQTELKN